MYPTIHSLAHRAPPASRTRVRWQPYGSLPSSAPSLSSVSSRSPASSSYSTPTSSAPSSPSTSLCDVERIKSQQPQQHQHQHQHPTPQPQTPRDAQPREKSKYALGLVDQAVKSLCEIWRPQDIPQVFLTSSRAMVPVSGSEHVHTQTRSHSNPSSHKRTQSSCPRSPSTQPSLPCLFPTPSEDHIEPLLSPRNLQPMKGFVHEVLRRSRTSGSVLQTALCYLEAIRSKVPELVRLEKAGEGIRGEPELAERITPATDAELQHPVELSSGMDTIILCDSDDGMNTVRPSDSYSGSTAVGTELIEDGDSTLKKLKSPSPPLAPLPSLPSPLLCPRRAFLASLILASKFTQDKCYSNRAWAKLSGLPPREIGRCERALGDALEWRLWVGKASPSAQQNSASPPTPATRTLSRCQSEALLRSTSSDRGGFLVAGDKKLHASKPATLSPPVPSSSSKLRRASTLPAGILESKLSHHNRNAVATWIHNSVLVAPEDQSLTDQSMDSPELSSVASHEIQHPFGGSISEVPVLEVRPGPSPSTPGLSYSPTSTESSSGDRTIQMSVFEDNMTPFNTSTASVATDMWPWLDALSFSKMVVNVSPSSFDREYKHMSAVQDVHVSLGANGLLFQGKGGPLGNPVAVPPVGVWG